MNGATVPIGIRCTKDVGWLVDCRVCEETSCGWRTTGEAAAFAKMHLDLHIIGGEW